MLNIVMQFSDCEVNVVQRSLISCQRISAKMCQHIHPTHHWGQIFSEQQQQKKRFLPHWVIIFCSVTVISIISSITSIVTCELYTPYNGKRFYRLVLACEVKNLWEAQTNPWWNSVQIYFSFTVSGLRSSSQEVKVQERRLLTVRVVVSRLLRCIDPGTGAYSREKRQ